LRDAGGSGDPASATSEQRLRASTERLALIRAFGEQLRARRQAADLSTGALAERCRVSVSTISKLELGRGGEPGLTMILIVCDGLAISTDMLLGELPTPQERRAKAKQ
jgi:transcriptional regulator with XRE-family HTH domain